jgi:hypothetical protein
VCKDPALLEPDRRRGKAPPRLGTAAALVRFEVVSAKPPGHGVARNMPRPAQRLKFSSLRPSVALYAPRLKASGSFDSGLRTRIFSGLPGAMEGCRSPSASDRGRAIQHEGPDGCRRAGLDREKVQHPISRGAQAGDLIGVAEHARIGEPKLGSALGKLSGIGRRGNSAISGVPFGPGLPTR